MPRGKKSKARAREKRDQNKDQSQGLKGAEGSTTESSSCSALASGDAVASTSSASSGDNLKSLRKRAKGRATSQASSSGGRPSSVTPKNDLLKSKTEMLVDFMLCKYKMKQPIVRGEMVRVINKRLKEHFPEILKRASQRLDVAFGLQLEEVQPNGQSFKLVSKLEFQDDGSSSLLGLPAMGSLVPILSVIYLNGSCVPEETIWEFLNSIGVYDGISHAIFGDARKFITEDLVREGYLEYRQVPDSNPPVYEFLWGPQAHTDSCMEKVLNFLIKYDESITPEEPPPYEDAWWEEEDKRKAEGPAKGGTKGKGKGRSKGKSKSRKHK